MKSTFYTPKIAVLAGEKGIGKTTWILTLAEQLEKEGKKRYGIATPKEITNRDVMGILAVDLISGQTERLASKDQLPGNRMGQWRFLQDGIDFCENACDPENHDGIAIIDEIGPMETEGRGLVKTTENLLNGKYLRALVVVRNQLMGAWAARFSEHSIVEIFDISYEKQQVTEFLKQGD